MDLENVYDKIYRYVYFRTGDRATAEDITQEAFLRLLGQKGSLHNYDIRYLYTIARNLCVDEFRRIKPEYLEEGFGETAAAPEDSPEERIALGKALDRLSPEEQEILLLRYVNEEAVGTISKALNISRFSVNRRLKSAITRLRGYLEDTGYED